MGGAEFSPFSDRLVSYRTPKRTLCPEQSGDDRWFSTRAVSVSDQSTRHPRAFKLPSWLRPRCPSLFTLVAGALTVPLLERWWKPVAVPEEVVPGRFHGAVFADTRTICTREEEPRAGRRDRVQRTVTLCAVADISVLLCSCPWSRSCHPRHPGGPSSAPGSCTASSTASALSTSTRAWRCVAFWNSPAFAQRTTAHSSQGSSPTYRSVSQRLAFRVWVTYRGRSCVSARSRSRSSEWEFNSIKAWGVRLCVWAGQAYVTVCCDCSDCVQGGSLAHDSGSPLDALLAMCSPRHPVVNPHPADCTVNGVLARCNIQFPAFQAMAAAKAAATAATGEAAPVLLLLLGPRPPPRSL